jgi:hypothetical protein
VDTGAEVSLLNTKLLSESFLEEKEGCETLRTVSGEEIKTWETKARAEDRRFQTKINI